MQPNDKVSWRARATWKTEHGLSPAQLDRLVSRRIYSQILFDLGIDFNQVSR